MDPILDIGQSLLLPAYELGINLVIISILLAGFAIGISRVINSKRLLNWGVEELIQAIINGILLGLIVSGSATLSTLASSIVPTTKALATCSFDSNFPNFISITLCNLDFFVTNIYDAVNFLYATSYSLSAIASININLNVIAVSPLSSLSYASEQFSKFASDFLFIATIIQTQREFLFFIAKTGFSIFLPIGLLLRMFFLTRKVGGAILAGAIGLYIFYPLFLLSLTFEPTSLENLNDVFNKSLNDLSSSISPFPQVDWGKEEDIVGLIFNLSKKDIAAKTSFAINATSRLVAFYQLYSYVFSLLTIFCTLIFIYQLADVLGSEFRLNIFQEL
jgi:hypothetical protein